MSSATSSLIRFKNEKGVTIVSLSVPDSVFMTKDVDTLDQDLQLLVAENAHPYKILLNLDGIRYLSSSMLGRLIMLQRKIDAGAGRFAVCSLTKVLRDTLRVSRIDHLIDIYEDESSALAMF